MALRVYNHPGCVKDARDKLRTLALLQAGGVPTVEWTTNREDAAAWLRDGVVFVRHSLTGQGGSGIEVLDPDVAVPVGADDMPQAPLYTRYFRARHEYRVHVIQGRTYVQKKRRRNGASTALVRNHANGYVYCTGGVEAPASVIQAGVSAVALLGLDFGAADILCTEGGTARVLEVNTAPGLEGSTLSFYAEHMQEMTNGS
jgi:glutathione synthase/RimK-type ligase-like ATP-grasp enzyme